MSNTNTGGPAFPTATLAQKTEGGMTLRDYFAATASEGDIMDAIAKIPTVDTVVPVDGGHRIVRVLPDNARQIARYRCADAMLKAREQ